MSDVPVQEAESGHIDAVCQRAALVVTAGSRKSEEFCDPATGAVAFGP